jgi:adenosine kinase
MVITTHGPEGVVMGVKGERTLFPAVKAERVLDPTGAGDALRGGLLKGWSLGLDWDICCQMGTVAASYAVEVYGTQEHRLTWESFCLRYEATYGPLLC